VKPDYVHGLRDTMDLILLGGYYGEGTRRTGGVSHFLLGVLEHPLTPSEIERVKDRKVLPPPTYTFCKVGSGYSIARLKELRTGEPKGGGRVHASVICTPSYGR
jgi:DNA ligase-4